VFGQCDDYYLRVILKVELLWLSLYSVAVVSTTYSPRIFRSLFH